MGGRPLIWGPCSVQKSCSVTLTSSTFCWCKLRRVYMCVCVGRISGDTDRKKACSSPESALPRVRGSGQFPGRRQVAVIRVTSPERSLGAGDRDLRFHPTEQSSLLPLCPHCWVVGSLYVLLAGLWPIVGQICVQVSAHSGANVISGAAIPSLGDTRWWALRMPPSC